MEPGEHEMQQATFVLIGIVLAIFTVSALFGYWLAP